MNYGAIYVYFSFYNAIVCFEIHVIVFCILLSQCFSIVLNACLSILV